MNIYMSSTFNSFHANVKCRQQLKMFKLFFKQMLSIENLITLKGHWISMCRGPVHSFLYRISQLNQHLSFNIQEFANSDQYMVHHINLVLVCIWPSLKGILSDSNNIFLWHESEDINKKSLNPKFQLIPILRFQVMHDSAFHCSHRLLC